MGKITLPILLLLLTSCSANHPYSVRAGNEAFIVGNNSEIGVLLTHGFEASPNEVKELAQYLADRNITVYVVRLKGHGTDIKELDNAKWQDWYKDYEYGYNELSKKAKKIFVAGHSLGGALALYLAEQKDTAGVISLASPVGLQDKRAGHAWLIKYFKKYEARNTTEEEKKYHYDKYSAAGVEQLVKFIEIYKQNLSKITEPILIIQLSNDTKIDSNSANYIYKNIKSKDKKIVIINATGHGLFDGDYKKNMYEEIYNFVKRV
ncbi:alpha/beta fold hydrolase [Candidatus Woesearchaeota archaeon]|nr:alpha/beta fold hydrolase [Candidatus Woesearchaeota archaeon]